MVTRTPTFSCKLITSICSRLELTSPSLGGTGPPGASVATVASCIRNIRRSGKTGISSRSSLRLTGPPSFRRSIALLACLGKMRQRRAMGHKGAGVTLRGGVLRTVSSCGMPGPWPAGAAGRAPGGGYPPIMTAPGADLGGITHRDLDVRGLRMHVAEQGSGPLVILCHGFPESWYSWRHQLAALAAAGFHAVAPDMRGYGQTDAPAVIAGHDWGAPVAWHATLLRPDLFRAVIALSVPFRPRGAVRPTAAMPRTDEAIFYQLYFQTPGVAEAELERDVRATMRRLAYSGSGNAPGRDNVAMVRLGGGFLDHTTDPETLPPWLTAADIEFYALEFGRTGFRGGLNWYRNIDRNWELLAPYAGARVTVPALYAAGDRDLVVAFRGMDQLIPNLRKFVPGLRRTLVLPGCGHWTQQERAREVNAAMLDFLGGL